MKHPVRKLIVLGAVVLLMVLALAAAAAPLGQDGAQDQAFPGKRAIEVEGASSTFGGTLQEPPITTSADSIIVEGADATFSASLRDPEITSSAAITVEGAAATWGGTLQEP